MTKRDNILDKAKAILEKIDMLDFDERIRVINEIRLHLHSLSPFRDEPVDCVLWVKSDAIVSNDYNPNTVAPPEMELLYKSILKDGYTQPIVAWKKEDNYEVVDGFHRHRVGREKADVEKRIHGYLPITSINDSNSDRGDRIAATIRHNRARGKHKVSSMSDIVVELKRRNWSNKRICENLGMDEDEVLRLCQITGLAELFTDQEFSKSWDIEGNMTEDDFKALSDDVNEYGEESDDFRTVNTGDENRIFHTYDKWECYKAGFYKTTKDGMKQDECMGEYKKFLSDSPSFEKALSSIISEWKHSCEQYLTNSSMNRIAWLGQASACYALGIPSTFRGGFNLLTPDEQVKANNMALIYLNKWLVANSRESVSMEAATGSGLQHDIY